MSALAEANVFDSAVFSDEDVDLMLDVIDGDVDGDESAFSDEAKEIVESVRVGESVDVEKLTAILETVIAVYGRRLQYLKDMGVTEKALDYVTCVAAIERLMELELIVRETDAGEAESETADPTGVLAEVTDLSDEVREYLKSLLATTKISGSEATQQEILRALIAEETLGMAFLRHLEFMLRNPVSGGDGMNHPRALAEVRRVLDEREAVNGGATSEVDVNGLRDAAKEAGVTQGSRGFWESPQQARVEIPFLIDARVAQRFNAYAAAAAPNEIGGLLRVARREDEFYVSDLKVFAQNNNHASFELDGAAVAQFNMELVQAGRADEFSQWCALIHSHPGFGVAMSSPDIENLRQLRGESQAFSVIVATTARHADPRRNRWVVAYAQAQPLPLMIEGIEVRADGGSLSALDLLSDEELGAIEAEVRELCGQDVRAGSLLELRDAPPANSISSWGEDGIYPPSRTGSSFGSSYPYRSPKRSRSERAPSETAGSTIASDSFVVGTVADSSYLYRPAPELDLREREIAVSALKGCRGKLPALTRDRRAWIETRLEAGQSLTWRQFGLLVRTCLRRRELLNRNPGRAETEEIADIDSLFAALRDKAVEAHLEENETEAVVAAGTFSASELVLALAAVAASSDDWQRGYASLEALLADLITNQPLYSAQANTLAGALRHWHPQRRSLSEGEILRAEIRVLSRKLAEAGAQADTGVFATSQRYGGYSGWSSGYGNTGTTLSESSSARLREALELAFANTPATETNNLLRTCIDRAREGLPLFEAERQMAVQAVLALRSTLLEDRETNAEQLGELKELLSALGKGVVRTTVETTDNLDEVAEDLDLALAEEPAHSEVTDAPVL